MYQLLGKKKKNQKGFTLIELIVVIAILAILAAILIPRFTGFQEKARRTQALVDAKQIATAIDSLVAESITQISVVSNNYPVDATTKTNVHNLSGVSTTQGAIVLESDGGFEYTTTVGSYKAGRDTGDTAVVYK